MRYLVLHNTTPVISDFARSLADFDLIKCDFDKAPRYKRDDGNKVIDVRWLFQQLDTVKYDGVIAVLNGNALSGIWGCHNKEKIGDKKISVLQVEHHKRLYREYVGAIGFAKLEPTRKKTPYYQPEYTFDHELIHSITYLTGRPDLLHIYVKCRAYDLYKNSFIK
jgi:hypothetical protein